MAAPRRDSSRHALPATLVERLPRRGSRVADWSPSDILQLFALRHVLERHAIQTALPLSDVVGALRPLREALNRMRSATDELDRDDTHRMFHASCNCRWR